MNEKSGFIVAAFVCLVSFCFGGWVGAMYGNLGLSATTAISGVASTIQLDQVYTVKTVRVIEGHVFDVYLENGKRYLVALRHVPGTPPEAKEKAVRRLNTHREREKKLLFVPRDWDDLRQRYVGDIYLDELPNSMTMTDWLTARALVYSR